MPGGCGTIGGAISAESSSAMAVGDTVTLR